MSSSRQLAAIMFTDIVGYTALMGADEQKAFGIFKKNRELQKPVIDVFHGRCIKELGDGLLASFPTEDMEIPNGFRTILTLIPSVMNPV